MKLDLGLIRGIQESEPRQSLVRALARVMHGLDTAVLAKGIEESQELETCLQLGCDLGQGFLFGAPSAEVAPRSGIKSGLRPPARALPASPQLPPEAADTGTGNGSGH